MVQSFTLLFVSLVMSLWKQDLMTASMSEVSEVAVLKADDAVPSPALAARYARLAALAREPAPAPAPVLARPRREARGQQFVIELAIFTDTEFHDFVRQKFIEEPDTEIRTIITNIILVTCSSQSLGCFTLHLSRLLSTLWSCTSTTTRWENHSL